MAVMQSFNASEDTTSVSTTSTTTSAAGPVDTLKVLPKLRQLVKQRGPHLDIAPVTVHANYCDNKKSNLGSLGLWLAEGFDSTSQCRPFTLNSTFFGKINW